MPLLQYCEDKIQGANKFAWSANRGARLLKAATEITRHACRSFGQTFIFVDSTRALPPEIDFLLFATRQFFRCSARVMVATRTGGAPARGSGCRFLAQKTTSFLYVIIVGILLSLIQPTAANSVNFPTLAGSKVGKRFVLNFTLPSTGVAGTLLVGFCKNNTQPGWGVQGGSQSL